MDLDIIIIYVYSTFYAMSKFEKNRTNGSPEHKLKLYKPLSNL